MKKVLALLLALTMAASLLAGCGGKPSAEDTPGGNGQTENVQKPEGPAGTPVGTDKVFVGGWPYSTVPTGHFNMFVANAIEL